ncbi:unnamed protein product [Staurois parvus]|uniref:Uncharacterized protein n=1 Tax=Staurois parvus TaxID=386267 RepID=A0ABN9C920_9NEOB|nr:unnamed protein product [Staurois parvus]
MRAPPVAVLTRRCPPPDLEGPIGPVAPALGAGRPHAPPRGPTRPCRLPGGPATCSLRLRARDLSLRLGVRQPARSA